MGSPSTVPGASSVLSHGRLTPQGCCEDALPSLQRSSEFRAFFPSAMPHRGAETHPRARPSDTIPPPCLLAGREASRTERSRSARDLGRKSPRAPGALLKGCVGPEASAVRHTRSRERAGEQAPAPRARVPEAAPPRPPEGGPGLSLPGPAHLLLSRALGHLLLRRSGRPRTSAVTTGVRRARRKARPRGGVGAWKARHFRAHSVETTKRAVDTSQSEGPGSIRSTKNGDRQIDDGWMDG